MSARLWFLKTGVGFLSAIAPGVVGRQAFRLFCTPPRTGLLSPGEIKVAARMGPVMATAQKKSIETPDASVVAYVWDPADGLMLRGTVLLVHGWTGRAMVMAAFVEPLRASGFRVVALDLPAHGNSTGKQLNLAIGARAVQAVARALGPFTGAIAHSFGGPATLLAAEGGLPLREAMGLDTLVMIACPNSLDAITHQFATAVGLSARAHAAMDAEVFRIAGRPVSAFTCDAFLSRIGIPALVIHDDGDAEVPIANALAIVAAAPKARLLTTVRLGHRRIIFAPSVIQESTAFLAGRAQSTNERVRVQSAVVSQP